MSNLLYMPGVHYSKDHTEMPMTISVLYTSKALNKIKYYVATCTDFDKGDHKPFSRKRAAGGAIKIN